MLQRVICSAPLGQKSSIRIFLSLFQDSNANPTQYSHNFHGCLLNTSSVRLRSSHHPVQTPKLSKMTSNIEQESPDPAEHAEDSHIRGPLNTRDIKQMSLLNDENSQAALDSLIESYNFARHESSNTWLYFETCCIYLYRGGGQPSSTLAAFDLDGTLLKPRRRSPKGATDWEFFSVWTKVKLQQAVHENEARFVIFTNQYGIGLKKVTREEIQERIELVTKGLGVPCTVLVATEKDEFRKPKTGMFKLFLRSFNNSSQVDCERSFYCGDAVGYPSHSDADIKFAESLGLPFLTPEKFVRGVKPKLVQAV